MRTLADVPPWERGISPARWRAMMDEIEQRDRPTVYPPKPEPPPKPAAVRKPKQRRFRF